jgi:hypothetical protein
MGAGCTCEDGALNFDKKWIQRRKSILESNIPTEKLLTELRESYLDYDKESITVINNSGG